MSDKGDDASKGAILILFILWGAFAVSCLVYASLILSGTLDRVGLESPPPVPAALLSLLAGGMIVAGIVTGFVLKPSSNSTPREFASLLLRRLIVQSAIFESIAILGLVAFVLGVGKSYSLILILVGFLAVAALLPGLLGGVEEFRRLRYRYLDYARDRS